MKKIKVLVLTTSFPLRENSTSGVFIERLVEKFTSDIEVLVLTPCDSDKNNVINCNRFKVKCFRYAPRRFRILAHKQGGIPAAIQSSKLNLILVPLFLITMFFKCFIEARNVDLIHANWSVCGFIGGLVAKIYAKPIITTIRGEDGNKAQTSIVFKLLLKLTVHYSSFVVCVSQNLVEKVKLISKNKDSNILFVPNGIDRNLLKFNLEKSLSEEAKEELNLVTVGNLTSNKNVSLVIKAVREIIAQGNNIKLNIIGDGPKRIELEKLVQRYDLVRHIKFHGSLHPKNVYDLIGKSTIFVLSSFREGRPNVLLESMAIGTPIIASNIEGVLELIEDGKSGLLFDPTSYTQLTQCINTLCSDKKLQNYLSLNAQQYIKKNNLYWEQSASIYSELYKTVLKSS